MIHSQNYSYFLQMYYILRPMSRQKNIFGQKFYGSEIWPQTIGSATPVVVGKVAGR